MQYDQTVGPEFWRKPVGNVIKTLMRGFEPLPLASVEFAIIRYAIVQAEGGFGLFSRANLRSCISAGPPCIFWLIRKAMYLNTYCAISADWAANWYHAA